MERRILLAGAGSLILLAGAIGFMTHNQYEKFDVEDNFTTERVYESCHCFGGMEVMESYPPQYSCQGLNYCRDVNYTREKSID